MDKQVFFFNLRIFLPDLQVKILIDLNAAFHIRPAIFIKKNTFSFSAGKRIKQANKTNTKLITFCLFTHLSLKQVLYKYNLGHMISVFLCSLMRAFQP